MAYVKTTVDRDLVVELHSGKRITASELVELQADWRFFKQFVQLVKNVLADLPKMPGWDAIQARLPHTQQGGACDWRDIVIILLVAPFLTQNNISALYKLLQGSPGLCVVLGLARVPSPGRISQYKNHLLGEPVFLRVRLKLAQRLKRAGGMTLKKLVIDGAPLFARANPRKLSMKKETPYEAIQFLFERLNLTWLDTYYPQRVWNHLEPNTYVHGPDLLCLDVLVRHALCIGHPCLVGETSGGVAANPIQRWPHIPRCSPRLSWALGTLCPADLRSSCTLSDRRGPRSGGLR